MGGGKECGEKVTRDACRRRYDLGALSACREIIRSIQGLFRVDGPGRPVFFGCRFEKIKTKARSLRQISPLKEGEVLKRESEEEAAM